MRNRLARLGYGFSGIVVAVCLTVVAYLIANASLGLPARPAGAEQLTAASPVSVHHPVGGGVAPTGSEPRIHIAPPAGGGHRTKSSAPDRAKRHSGVGHEQGSGSQGADGTGGGGQGVGGPTGSGHE